jgi:hypothetical protein
VTLQHVDIIVKIVSVVIVAAARIQAACDQQPQCGKQDQQPAGHRRSQTAAAQNRNTGAGKTAGFANNVAEVIGRGNEHEDAETNHY